MKKYALLMSVGLIAASAAQAAPDFYGKFNVSLDKNGDYPFGSLTSGVGLVDAWALESNRSRLGVRGSEPLFNKEMKVIYQFEVAADVDGDGSTFTSRNSYLGLDTNAGKFFAGNYDSVIKQAEGKIDQFNDTGADIDLLFFGQRRLSNTLNWESPELSGLTFRLQAAPGEGAGLGDEVKDGLADTLGASVILEQDNVVAALAIESSFHGLTIVDPTDPLATLFVVADTQTIRASGGVTLDGGVEFGAIFEAVELDPQFPGADEVDGFSFLFSGKLEANERLALKAQLGKFDSSDLDLEIMLFTAGADYRLGKQTKFYGLLSMSDIETFGFDTLGNLVEVDESGNLISVGLVHAF